MRYLKHVETNVVRQIPEDDQARFAATTAEKLTNGRAAWAQTGPQDPAVAAAVVAESGLLFGQLPASAQAVDAVVTLGEAPDKDKVTGVEYVPAGDITGADTDTRTITVVNKGQDGTGTTVVATLALANGVDAAGYDATAFTLSGTAANKKVDAGDVLAAESTHAGAGLADPGGQVRVTLASQD